AQVEELTSTHHYDLMIASEIDMAIYGLQTSGTKKVLEELEVTKILAAYRQETNLLKKLRGGLTWWKLSGYVRRLLKDYDGCTVVSEQEAQALIGIYPGKKPAVIPNGVDCAYYRQECEVEPEPDTLIFNGSITYSVNFDAAAYFIEQILPLIQTKRPQVRLLITGKVTPALIQALPQNSGVDFTGFLEDIRPTLFRAWANVVPLTIGGGTRLKILEAMAAGLPVISTSIGAEGLEVEPGKNILLADQPEAFAQAVLDVLGDSELRNQLAQNGRKAVETRYDWEQINQGFHGYLHQVMQA
ncbi:MAG TPA: glycosyltransferase family 4 protein, partial [Anaerolinea sp.]|nr:glycosyltransferase family 4 protein [Anaerolinea sp.]